MCPWHILIHVHVCKSHVCHMRTLIPVTCVHSHVSFSITSFDNSQEFVSEEKTSTHHSTPGRSLRSGRSPRSDTTSERSCLLVTPSRMTTSLILRGKIGHYSGRVLTVRYLHVQMNTCMYTSYWVVAGRIFWMYFCKKVGGERRGGREWSGHLASLSVAQWNLIKQDQCGWNHVNDEAIITSAAFTVQGPSKNSRAIQSYIMDQRNLDLVRMGYLQK